VTITEPADGAAVASDFSVKATAGDDCRVASADVEIQPWNEKATTIGPGRSSGRSPVSRATRTTC
jgi:hypothetical protein